MRKFNSIFKIILESLLIFTIFFIWLNFYLKSKTFALIISLFLTAIIEGISQGARRTKNDKSSLKEKEQLDAEKMFMSLIKSGKSSDFFIKMFSSRYNKVHREKNAIILEKNHEKIAFYPLLKYQKIGQDDIVLVMNKLIKINPTKIIIICGDTEPKLKDFVKSYSSEITILDKYQTYASLYKEFDFYPIIEDNIKPPRQSFKTILSSFFNHSHARGFIVSALFLLLGSYFTKMNLYYLISTSILLFFGLICLFNKKEKVEAFSF